jgi:hypothetical protein
MPHESSAVADLVSLAHREPIHASPDPGDPNFGGRGDKSGLSAPWIVVIGLVVIGASVAGGYLMARQEEPASDAASAAASAANTESGLEPQVAAKVEAAAKIETDAEAGEEEIEPEPSGQLGEVDIELAKVTGFDVLVEPSGAKVTLDGQAIGAAPLRVRNLLPGKHAIDIEGPDGYFGKHLEFDLQAGDAEVLNLVLQAVGGAPPPVTEPEPIASVADSSDSDEEDQGDADTAEGKKPAKTKRRNKNDKNKRDRRRFKASADEERILDKAEKVALGTLMLGAKPPCDIIINGKKTGLVTPQRAIQLPAGMHRVILVNKKFKIRKSFKVNIKSGMTTRAIQDLSAEL